MKKLSLPSLLLVMSTALSFVTYAQDPKLAIPAPAIAASAPATMAASCGKFLGSWSGWWVEWGQNKKVTFTFIPVGSECMLSATGGPAQRASNIKIEGDVFEVVYFNSQIGRFEAKDGKVYHKHKGTGINGGMDKDVWLKKEEK
jgi:hypothetical protein